MVVSWQGSFTFIFAFFWEDNSLWIEKSEEKRR
jgi:hypothetical protein